MYVGWDDDDVYVQFPSHRLLRKFILEANSEGKIAIRHHNSNGTNYQVGDRTYTWIPKYNVSLAWVDEVDWPALNVVMLNVCCGHTGHKFFLANANDVSIHETGHAL